MVALGSAAALLEHGSRFEGICFAFGSGSGSTIGYGDLAPKAAARDCSRSASASSESCPAVSSQRQASRRSTPPSRRGFGLLGSGLFIANPPHVLHDTLAPLMQTLVDLLGQYDGAHYLLEQRAA